ncbi:MAG: hypothetical protein Q9228_007442 [Teloschistes exilis]
MGCEIAREEEDWIDGGRGCCVDGYRVTLVGEIAVCGDGGLALTMNFEMQEGQERIGDLVYDFAKVFLGEPRRIYPLKATMERRPKISGTSAVPSDIHRYKTGDGSARVTIWTALEKGTSVCLSFTNPAPRSWIVHPNYYS